MPPHYTIIADPQSPRWEAYQGELLNFWSEHRVTPQIHLIPWGGVIPRAGDLSGLLADEPTLLRIESPGSDIQLLGAFLQAGERANGIPDAPAWEVEPGWIGAPKVFYAGFCHVLEGIARSVVQNSQVTQLADVNDIMLMFDKNRSTAKLVAAGLSCPETHRPPEKVDALYRQLERLEWRESFLKLAYGSCASGMIHFQRFYRAISAVGTAIERDGKFYNTMRLQKLDGQQLDRLVQFILDQQGTLQRGIRKACLVNQNFDVRVVVIRGQVAAIIFRVSPHPMTNLHLGGFRGSSDQLRRLIPARQWAEGIAQCLEAAEQFQVPIVGIDLMFEDRTFQPYLIEVNAFGDFFPNWTNAAGHSIHRQEIESTARNYGLL